MVDRIAVDEVDEGGVPKVEKEPEAEEKYKEGDVPEHHCKSHTLLIVLRQILSH